MGQQLPEHLKKHAKIFQKMILQLSFQTKKSNLPKHEFEHFSLDFQSYFQKSKCHEMIITDYYINMAETLVIFKISNLTLKNEGPPFINRLRIMPEEIY